MDNEFARYPGVELKSGRVSGKWTLGRSRVPAELVAECLDNGETPEQIAYNYDLSLQEILHFNQYREAHQTVTKS